MRKKLIPFFLLSAILLSACGADSKPSAQTPEPPATSEPAQETDLAPAPSQDIDPPDAEAPSPKPEEADMADPIQQPEEPDAAEPPQESDSQEESEPDADRLLSLSDIVLIHKAMLSSYDKLNFMQTVTTSSYIVTAWCDGIANEIERASQGDSESLAAWGDLLNAWSSSSEEVRSLLDENECGDIAYTFQLVDDRDERHATILLSISDGAVTYDYVNKIGVTEDSPESSDLLSMSDIVLMNESIFPSTDSVNVTHTVTSDSYIVTMSSDGLANNAERASKGDSEPLATWGKLVDTMLSSTESFQSILNDNGHSNIVYTIQLVDDRDKSNATILLSVANGQILFDYVNNADSKEETE